MKTTPLSFAHLSPVIILFSIPFFFENQNRVYIQRYLAWRNQWSNICLLIRKYTETLQERRKLGTSRCIFFFFFFFTPSHLFVGWGGEINKEKITEQRHVLFFCFGVIDRNSSAKALV
jgi:hypothetical protein